MDALIQFFVESTLLQSVLVLALVAIFNYGFTRFAVVFFRKRSARNNWNPKKTELRVRVVIAWVSILALLMFLPITDSTRGQLLSLYGLVSIGLFGFLVIEPLRHLFLPDEYQASSGNRRTQVEPGAADAEGFEGKIFVSYRREDSQNVVDRLCDKLFDRLGRDNIFRDIDSITLGRDFRGVVNQTLDACSVGLVVLGPEWLGEREGGTRRIDQDGDLVRLEVKQMLSRDIPVIPVLVEDTQMPAAAELPEDLGDLVFRNAARLRPDPDFGTDVDRLIRGIKQALTVTDDSTGDSSPG